MILSFSFLLQGCKLLVAHSPMRLNVVCGLPEIKNWSPTWRLESRGKWYHRMQKLHVCVWRETHQGSHTLLWDWGQGPLALGKMAAFCLKLGKNKKTYFVIHILVSFNMFKCTCTFIHRVLLEIHVQFHRSILLKFVIFSHLFFNFFSRS